MNLRLPLLSAALVSLLFPAPASATTATLFHESFDENSQSWSGSGNKDSFGTTDNAGWSISSGNVYPGQKGLRLGTASVLGGAQSPSFALSNRTEDVAITIIAAAHQTATGTQTIHVDVLDSSSGTNEMFSATLTKISADEEIPATASFIKTFTLSAAKLPVSGNISLNLYGESTSTSQRRVLVGDVLVTQNFDTGLPQLDMPEHLVAPSTNYTGFSLSWSAVSDATAYEVSVNDVVVTNCGPSETTATVTGLTEGEPYDVSVVAKGDGTTHDDSDAATLRVTTLTAPAVTAPVLNPSAVSSSSFTVSWPAQPAADHFSVRAWTLVPADIATEDFVDYALNGNVPDGWIFENTHDPFDYHSSSYTHNPVDFKASGNWIASPEFGGVVTSVTFRVRSTAKFTGSFTVYGTTGSTNRSDWTSIQSWEKQDEQISVSTQTLSVLEENGFTRLIFAFEKTAGSGSIAFGSFSVTGTGVGKARSYLEGYGSDAAGVTVGGTSVTVSNPVAGETNYVEVTATGFTGRTAASELGVPVPGRPVVISVK